MPRVRYPETLALRVRQGVSARIDAAVDAADTDRGQWLREAVMRALDAAERAARRRKAAA